MSCECVNNNNDFIFTYFSGAKHVFFQISNSNRCICSASFSSKGGGEHILIVGGLSSVRLSVSLLLLLLLVLLLLLPLHFERLLMHADRMGYVATGAVIGVVSVKELPERHDVVVVVVFNSCLEAKTLARLLLLLLLLLGGCPVRSVPVDVVEVGRIGETPSLAPVCLWTMSWVRPLQSVPAVAYF